MSANKVVLLKVVRDLKKSREDSRQASLDLIAYRAKLLQMEKLALLDEMIHFQQERSEAGQLTLELAQRGQILFQILQENAESEELRSLARSYKRHLALELKQFVG